MIRLTEAQQATIAGMPKRQQRLLYESLYGNAYSYAHAQIVGIPVDIEAYRQACTAPASSTPSTPPPTPEHPSQLQILETRGHRPSP